MFRKLLKIFAFTTIVIVMVASVISEQTGFAAVVWFIGSIYLAWG